MALNLALMGGGRNIFEKVLLPVGTAGFEPANPLTSSHVPGVAGRGSVSLSGHWTRLDSRLASLGVA